MKIKWVISILALSILLVPGLACGSGDDPTLTPTPTQEPTPGRTPTKCEADRDAIQVVLGAYHDDTGEWPTADGQPGDIEWDELVPGFLDEVPSTDSKCEWQVNSDPEGQVCLWDRC
jgi:hypothetical protein